MRYTPLYRLPALEGGDTAKTIYDQSWAAMLAVEAALANEGQLPLGGDLQALIKRMNAVDAKNTGWVQPTMASGVSPGNEFGVRINNGRVEWRGTVSRPAGQFPNGYTVIGTLPGGASSKYRPSQYVRVPVATYNGFGANLVVNPGDGIIQIGYSSSVALSDAFYVGGVSYDAV
jgi:hypothetical protein